MANGYIGKISAIVTASTADLSRKLQGSTREVNRFANSIRSQIGTASRSAQSSFNDIFTAAQKVERALQAGTTLRNRRGIALIDPGEADRIRRVVSVAQGINRPAIAAKRSFESLSLEIRGALQPSLERMQRSVDFVNRRIEVFGTISPAAFERTQRTIRETTIAINQLAQAQQRLSTLATGNELEFSDPRLAGNLAAAQRAGQQALALPSRAIESDPQIAGLLQQINAVSTRATEAAARVKSSIGNPALFAEATKESARLNAVLERLVARVGRKISVIVDTEQADERLAALKAQLEQTLTGRPANFDQVAAEYQRLRGEVEKLEVAQRQAFSAGLGELITLIAKDDVANLERARTLIEQIAAGLEGIKPAATDRLSAASERLRERAERERQAADAREAELEVSEGQRSAIPTRRQGRARILDQLGGEIDVVDRKVSALPEALQLQLGPEISRIQNKFRLLARDGIEFAAKEADELAAKVREITAALNNRQARGRQFLEGFGGAGEAGLNLGIDERQLRGIEAEFEFLQSRITAVGAETRGPLVSAMQRYRQVVKQAFDDGTISTRQGQKAIADSRAEVVRLAASLIGVKPSRLAADLKRVGDVSRGSFGNAGLAIQQAAFAIDDFFSVTGGLDQRIRAAGNNISQLGFIVGGTTGLIAGIAASITSQLVVALIKWQNAGTDTEDRVKSLNDSLARQKSLVESLAEAYRSVGESIEASGFSDATRQTRERERTIEGLRRNQDEQLRERVAGLDPAVQRERAIQAARQRELEAADDAGERVRLQREIQASRDREREAANAAFNRPAITAEQAVQSVADSIFRAEAAAIEDRARRAAGVGPTSGEAAEQQRQRDLAAAERRREEFLATGIGRVRSAGDARSQAAEAGRIIDEAQSEIASSITTGIVGFFDGANAARRRELARLEEQRAQLERDIFRSATNEVAIEATRTAIEASSAIGEAIAVLSEAIGGQSSVVQNELERLTQTIVDAEAALARAQETGNVDAAEAARGEIDAANRQKDAAISAANSVAAFAAVLDRVSNQLADTVAGEARGRADQARREDNRQRGLADAGLGFPGDADAAQRQRERAEADARAAEDRRDRVRRQNNLRRELFERDAIAGRAGDEAQQAIRDRDEAQRRLDEAERANDVAGANAARRDRDRAQARLDRAFEDSPSGRTAARRADELDREEAVRRERSESIDRGRELGRSPAERAGRELAQNLRDLDAAFEDAGRPQAGQADFEADRRRIIEDAFRQTAPAIFNLADQVANAVLQGPSRAALNATDVSTVEGSRELNRLLRGDDAARDQNLVELQKQSQSLDELVRIAREGGVPVAN